MAETYPVKCKTFVNPIARATTDEEIRTFTLRCFCLMLEYDDHIRQCASILFLIQYYEDDGLLLAPGQ